MPHQRDSTLQEPFITLITERLVEELGMSLAGVARLLGVSTSAISKILQRIAQKKSE